MAIRGTVTLECDSKGCHAEEVIGDLEFDVRPLERGLEIEMFSAGWRMDDDGKLHCPQCQEERERDADDGSTYADPRDERDARRHG